MNATNTQLVLVEERYDGRVALLILNRPDATNAIDDDMALAIEAAVATITASPRIEAVVLTGAGRIFCSGGDVGVFKAALDSGDDGELARLLDRLATRIHGALEALVNAGPLLIAAVNGPATGAGLGFVCACDFAYAKPSATLRPGFSKLGLSPDTGTTQFLPRIVGARKALELLIRGDAITPEAATQLDIYNEVIEADDAAFIDVVLERVKPLIASGRAACENAAADPDDDGAGTERSAGSRAGFAGRTGGQPAGDRAVEEGAGPLAAGGFSAARGSGAASNRSGRGRCR